MPTQSIAKTWPAQRLFGITLSLALLTVAFVGQACASSHASKPEISTAGMVQELGPLKTLPQNFALDAQVEAVPVVGSYCHGPADALVTVVEFSDFQCGHCARAQETLAALAQSHPGELRVCYRARPIPFHFNARDAAEALYAAGAQGRFWPMHDLLFANQRALEQNDLARYAEQLGLDVELFNQQRLTEPIFALVDRDESLAVELQVKMLPSSFINGRRISGAKPYQDFEQAFSLAKADALRLRKAGVSKTELYAVLYRLARKNRPQENK